MSNRIEKLNSEFKRNISQLLSTKIQDPRLTEMFTILSVECDRELATAKVYVSIYSTDVERSAKTFLAIKESEFFIRQQISKQMHIRTVPQFNFVLDTTLEHSQRINEILNEILPNS